MTRFLLPLLVAVAGLPFPAFADAGIPDVRVSHADLDLDRPSDLKILDRRLARAITRVCPDAYETSLLRNTALAECRKAKRDSVAAQRARLIADAKAGVAMAAAR